MDFLQIPASFHTPEDKKPSPKIIKVRRRLLTPQNQEATVSQKTFNVAHKVSKPQPSETPLPGSIEEDFLLESSDKPIHFLRIKNPKTGKFEINPHIFTPESEKNPPITPSNKEILSKAKKCVTVISAAEVLQKPVKTLSFQNLSRKPTVIVNPEVKYKEKIQQIKEGMKKEAEAEERLLKSLKTGQRITETMQKHSLENYYSTSHSWHKISNFLSHKLKKEPQDLRLNSAPNFRQKKEACELLDKIVPLKDKYGVLAWNLTLRQWPKSDVPGEVWIPIGGQLSGLYTTIRHRSNTSQEFIRTVGSHCSSRGSLRNSQYFKQKLEENQSKDQILLDKELDDMMVLGESKFPIEKSAAEMIGVRFLATDIGNNVMPEQTIELNYEVKVKY
ncbi:unnamed protein product [Blepharisma stoltei]|uniref:Uncharacterized protein n=1 Tax=Blepharisma stoltei TaxID=1481888 RepID=A0AAU9JBI7_9CILI|nr:unnamed protein product [Blepharisma stoltei]